MVAVIAGLMLLTTTGPHTAFFPTIGVSFFLIGLGIGTAFMPLLQIAMADVPAADAGLGSGIVNVSQQISGALGLAVLSTIATNHTQVAGGRGHVAHRRADRRLPPRVHDRRAGGRGRDRHGAGRASDPVARRPPPRPRPTRRAGARPTARRSTTSRWICWIRSWPPRSRPSTTTSTTSGCRSTTCSRRPRAQTSRATDRQVPPTPAPGARHAGPGQAASCVVGLDELHRELRVDAADAGDRRQLVHVQRLVGDRVGTRPRGSGSRAGRTSAGTRARRRGRRRGARTPRPCGGP